MTPDVAAVVITAITLPYANQWVNKYFTDLPKRREHKLAKAAVKDGAK